MDQDRQDDRPTCAVSGMIYPGAMCGKIIVGMKYCGYSGECPHKQEQPANTKGASHGH